MSAQMALAGMVLHVAFEKKLDAVEILKSALTPLPHGAFEGDAKRIMDAVQIALELGQSPASGTLKAIDGSLTGQVFTDARRAADEENAPADLAAAVVVVTREFNLRRITSTLTAALAATQKGQLEEATATLSALDLGSLSGASQRLLDFHDHDLDAEDATRHFQLSHAGLNKVLGGGLGAGLSLWVAPSGMGKSSFWWGEAPNLVDQGHWVILFCAEADSSYVFNQIVRLRAEMTEEAFLLKARRATPRFADRANKAGQEIAAMTKRGQLTVWQDAFSPQTVREVAETTLLRMRESGAGDKKLFVIVDNYDALFENLDGGDNGGPQAVNNEMQRLQRATRQGDYHIALLAQASSEAEKMLGPCGQSDVYGNKKLSMKVSQMVVLYRPKTEEARNMVNKDDGKPHVGSKAWAVVRKKRGLGEEGKLIEFSTDCAWGGWTEANRLPF